MGMDEGKGRKNLAVEPLMPFSKLLTSSVHKYCTPVALSIAPSASG